MIVEFDGYEMEVMLTGKKCSKKELKQKYLKAKEMVEDESKIHHLFCRIYGFDEISYDKELVVDFVIDTDTDYIYKPNH